MERKWGKLETTWSVLAHHHQTSILFSSKLYSLFTIRECVKSVSVCVSERSSTLESWRRLNSVKDLTLCCWVKDGSLCSRENPHFISVKVKVSRPHGKVSCVGHKTFHLSLLSSCTWIVSGGGTANTHNIHIGMCNRYIYSVVVVS